MKLAKRIVLASLGLLLAVEIILAAWSDFGCRAENYDQTANSQTYHDERKCSFFGAALDGPTVLGIKSVYAAFHAAREDLNALSTFFIFVFTAVLGIVSFFQIRLARDEFISTHRPRIVVRGFNVLDHAALPGTEETVEFLYVNIGATKAHVYEIGVATELSEPSGGLTFVNTKIKGVILTSGDKEIFSATSRRLFNARIQASIARSGHAMKAYVVGYVRYRDDRGGVRETGFCRETDFHSRRWNKTLGSEYEYED
ncbi:MAG TPA: hypothetical protein VGJ31_08720 [Dongiaceae bacterium]